MGPLRGHCVNDTDRDRLCILIVQVSWDRALQGGRVTHERCSWNGRPLGGDSGERLHDHYWFISWSWNVYLYVHCDKVSSVGSHIMTALDNSP